MDNASFSIAFEGQPFDKGEIDIKDLAPALLALGDIVQSANKALNGDRAEARLKVRATKEGSFEALLALDVSWITDMLDLAAANPDRMSAAKDIVDLLFKAGGGVGATTIGVVQALKFFRGKKPEKIEEKSSVVSITIDNTTIQMEPQAFTLLRDQATREKIEKFSKRTLNINGLDSVRIEGGADKEPLSITSSEMSALRIPEPSDDEVETQINHLTLWLKLVTPQFEDGYKWRFSDGGEHRFTAIMEDTDFLNPVLAGDVTMSANDTLRCLIREEQEIRGGNIVKTVFVERVYDHRRGDTQLRLI
ncbi:hypothetical protein [Pseudaestuariivita rosea]|uniref:hypothetical protein n=1 Tax=Pseudaestuariivita rosea TaxID=2763263 RepID=UPI001ABBC413|nr:hypothetical protein [Pseudaestuariivita rosea]